MAEALARELVEEGNIEILEPPVLHGLFFGHVALFIVRSFRQQRVPVHNREIAAHGFFLSTLFLRIRLPETLEEIAIRYASLYRSHGGGELRYIPALNDSPGHIKALATLLRRHLRGWAPGPRIS